METRVPCCPVVHDIYCHNLILAFNDKGELNVRICERLAYRFHDALLHLIKCLRLLFFEHSGKVASYFILRTLRHQCERTRLCSVSMIDYI